MKKLKKTLSRQECKGVGLNPIISSNPIFTWITMIAIESYIFNETNISFKLEIRGPK